MSFLSVRLILLTALAAALMTFVGSARADEAHYWLLTPVFTHHYNREKPYNERNWGLGVQRRWGDYGLAAGTYENSFYRQTYYIAGQWLPVHIGPIRIGGLAGIFTGYGTVPVPAAAGLISVEGDRFGVDVIVGPSLREAYSAVIVLAKWRFM